MFHIPQPWKVQGHLLTLMLFTCIWQHEILFLMLTWGYWQFRRKRKSDCLLSNIKSFFFFVSSVRWTQRRRMQIQPPSTLLDWCLADSQLQCVINFLLVPSSNPIIINEASEIWRGRLSAARWQADGRNGEIHRGQRSSLCGKAGIWPWAAWQTAAAQTSDAAHLVFDIFNMLNPSLPLSLYICWSMQTWGERSLWCHKGRWDLDGIFHKASNAGLSQSQLKMRQRRQQCIGFKRRLEWFCWRLQTEGW